MNAAEYQVLAANRNDKEQYPVSYYSSVQEGMFRSLIGKYMNGPGHHGGHGEGHGDHQASATEPVAMCTSGDK